MNPGIYYVLYSPYFIRVLSAAQCCESSGRLASECHEEASTDLATLAQRIGAGRAEEQRKLHTTSGTEGEPWRTLTARQIDV
jgi:hypothetical protein